MSENAALASEAYTNEEEGGMMVDTCPSLRHPWAVHNKAANVLKFVEDNDTILNIIRQKHSGFEKACTTYLEKFFNTRDSSKLPKMHFVSREEYQRHNALVAEKHRRMIRKEGKLIQFTFVEYYGDLTGNWVLSERLRTVKDEDIRFWRIILTPRGMQRLKYANIDDKQLTNMRAQWRF